MKRLLQLSFLLILCLQSHAQDSSNVAVDADNFNYNLLEKHIVKRINELRSEQNIKVLEEMVFLRKTAYEQAKYMAQSGLMEQDDPGGRAVLFGGTRNVFELIGKENIKQDGAYLTYGQLAAYAIDNLLNNKKKVQILYSTMYSLIGVSAVMDAAKKKVYYAIDFGNMSSIAPQMDASWAKYIGAKTYGIYYADKDVCKKCKRFVNINELVNNVVVEDGIIYFVYSDLKKLSRMLKDPYDGLAVDIIQREQLQCNGDNKINYMLPYKGLFLKPVYWPTMLKKNEIKDPKENKIKVAMGELPEGLDDVYEINIIVLIDKYTCRNLYRNYIEKPKEHKYSYDIMLPKDPKHKESASVSSANIDATYQKQMCYRSSNSAFKNKQNFFDCTFCKLRLPEKFTDSDVSAVGAAIDKMKGEGEIGADTLRKMEFELIVRILSEMNNSESIKEAIVRYSNIDTEKLDPDLVYTLFYLLYKHDEYDFAMDLFADYYMLDNIDEDMLFSFITLSSLTPERLQANSFIESMEIAEKLNHERYCNLVSDEKLSFQVFECVYAKEYYCEKCLKDEK